MSISYMFNQYAQGVENSLREAFTAVVGFDEVPATPKRPEIVSKFGHGQALADAAYDLADNYKFSKEDKYHEYRLLDSDGVTRPYHVAKFNTVHGGLVGYVMFSTDPSNPRIHVTFRGTTDFLSIQRDLETLLPYDCGVGGCSFVKDKKNLLDLLYAVLITKQQRSELPLQLTIAGHSLGGADAQNFMDLVLAKLASDQNSPLAELAEINLFHMNSAGVSAAAAESSEKNLERVNQLYPNLKVSQYVIQSHGDILQQSGHNSVLASSKLADTYLLKSESGRLRFLPKSMYDAHVSRAFDPKSGESNLKYQIYHNQQNEDERSYIKSSLGYKIRTRAKKVSIPYMQYKAARNAMHAAYEAAFGNFARVRNMMRGI